MVVLRECRICGIKATTPDELKNFVTRSDMKYGKAKICKVCDNKRYVMYNRTKSNTKDYSGYIYVLQHPAYKGWYKIGRAKNLTKRLSSYNTGTPHRDYSFVFTKEVLDVYVEQEVHGKLKDLDIETKGEWFKCNIKTITKVVSEVC